MKKYKPYIISILIALATGALSALITKNYMNIYSEINRPPLVPPSAVFPIVWTVLYILMGYSAARVYVKAKENNSPYSSAIAIYGLQLIVNFFWSIIFFKMRAFFFAFLWILLLIILVALMIYEFYKTDKKAALLQVPYLLWLLFATYLSYATFVLN